MSDNTSNNRTMPFIIGGLCVVLAVLVWQVLPRSEQAFAEDIPVALESAVSTLRASSEEAKTHAVNSGIAHAAVTIIGMHGGPAATASVPAAPRATALALELIGEIVGVEPTAAAHTRRGLLVRSGALDAAAQQLQTLAAEVVATRACACLALAGVGPGENLWRLGFVASFCSKLSDTTASEVGKAYGKTTYMSTPPFRSVPRGTEGAVSLEGTVAGIGASLGFAGVAAAAGQVDLTGALIATLAAFVATTAESWLGATTQGEAGFEWLTNDVVNAVQITLAAAVAVALGAAVGCG